MEGKQSLTKEQALYLYDVSFIILNLKLIELQMYRVIIANGYSNYFFLRSMLIFRKL